MIDNRGPISDAEAMTGNVRASGTLAERLAPLREQERYISDVEERGLEALLEPYAGTTALIPQQRSA